MGLEAVAALGYLVISLLFWAIVMLYQLLTHENDYSTIHTVIDLPLDSCCLFLCP